MPGLALSRLWEPFFSALVYVATLQDINIDRILPLFDQGVPPVAQATLTATSFIGPNVIMVTMLLPFVKVKERAFRSAAVGLTFGGIMFIFFFIAELMVMGPHVTAQMRIACMDLVRSVQISKYLHRMESFMGTFWYWSILVQSGILTYCAALAFQQTIGFKKINKVQILFIGVLLVSSLRLVAYNRIFFLKYMERAWEYISIPLVYGIPLVLLFLTLVRKPKHNKPAKNETTPTK